MEKHVTSSAEETQEIARYFVASLRPGKVYAFSGDLGAGKTTFIQGLLSALGAEGPFTSPTFTIVNAYELSENSLGHRKGIYTVYHMDAYRIDGEDVASIGWEEMMSDPHAIIFVEWPEKIVSHLPNDAIGLDFMWRDESREITLPEY